MTYKVDIMQLLNDIGKGNMSAIDKMSPDEVKSISPFVLQMWINGADVHVNTRINLTNRMVNPYIFNLQDHPKLLFKLLCYTNDLNERVSFRFRKKKSAKKHNFKINMLVDFHRCTINKAKDLLLLYSERDLLEIGEELGYEKDELKKLT